jgi:hypothetical protein
MEHQRITFFINSAGKNYPIFKLFQTKKDPSIYLHLSKHNELKRSGIGRLTFEGTPSTPLIGRIEYTNSEVFFKPIDHSSVHKDGTEHIKFFDKTYHSMIKGLPLKNLAYARHLWTIIPGSFRPEDIVSTLPKNPLILNIPDNVCSVAVVILAVPKELGTLHFSFSFPVEDMDMTTKNFPMNVSAVNFNQYTICFFAYSTLKFISPPPTTYAFPDIHNLAPFVKQVNKKFIELELRGLTFNSTEPSKTTII